jgi:hypothetical protein
MILVILRSSLPSAGLRVVKMASIASGSVERSELVVGHRNAAGFETAA